MRSWKYTWSRSGADGRPCGVDGTAQGMVHLPSKSNGKVPVFPATGLGTAAAPGVCLAGRSASSAPAAAPPRRGTGGPGAGGREVLQEPPEELARFPRRAGPGAGLPGRRARPAWSRSSAARRLPPESAGPARRPPAAGAAGRRAPRRRPARRPAPARRQAPAASPQRAQPSSRGWKPVAASAASSKARSVAGRAGAASSRPR